MIIFHICSCLAVVGRQASADLTHTPFHFTAMRRFKKIAKYLLFSFLGLVLLLFLIIQFFGGSIVRSVIAGLNENLQTEITVGDARLSMLRSFPNLSVDLTEVNMAGSDGGPLLECEQLSCRIGLSSLFGRTHVKQILIADGSLRIVVDQDGNPNYLLTGYTPVGVEPEPAAEATEFAIDDARLQNVEFIYENEQLRSAAMLQIDWAEFSGDFGQVVYQMESEATAQIHFIENQGQRFLEGKYVTFAAQTQVDNDQQFYQFERVRLGLGLLAMELNGGIRITEDGMDLDLNFGSDEGRLTDLLSLLPENYLGPLAQLESRGSWLLNGSVLGPWTSRISPRVLATVDFSRGRLRSPHLDASARDIAFQANFSNGDLQRLSTSVLEINNFSGSLDGEDFELYAKMENLNAPRLQVRLDGHIAMGALPGILPLDNLQEGRGFLHVNGLELSGRYEDMLRPRRMGQVRVKGNLELDNAAFELNDRQVRFPSGTLVLDNNRMQLQELVLEAPGTVVDFNGEATNLIPVLFADSLNSQDAALEFDALLRGRSLDIDELLNLYGVSDEEVAAAEGTAMADSLRRRSVVENGRITDLLEGRFELQIDEWNYGQIEGEGFTGELRFAQGHMDLNGQTEAMDGQFQLDGRLDFRPLPRIEARVTASQVDVTEFFRQGENFGQEILTAENLEGNLNSRMTIKASFDEAGYLDYDRLHIQAGIGIYDGELHDFGMLNNFAAFLKARDLERVRFSQLENFLEIKNNTVYIPVMFIQSSAMNMTISGEHSFTNRIDYNIKVNAGQVMANKIAGHDEDLSLLRARRNGFFNMYFKIHGTVENFNYERAKREVKQDFRRSEAYRLDIRQDLERSFNTIIRLVEEPADWLDAGEGLDIVPGSDGELDFGISGGGRE